MKLTTKILIGLGILLLIMWNPVTRMIFLKILPLGKGVDDLLFWIIITLFLTVAFVKGWVRIPHFYKTIVNEEENRNDKI